MGSITNELANARRPLLFEVVHQGGDGPRGPQLDLEESFHWSLKSPGGPCINDFPPMRSLKYQGNDTKLYRLARNTWRCGVHGQDSFPVADQNTTVHGVSTAVRTRTIEKYLRRESCTESERV